MRLEILGTNSAFVKDGVTNSLIFTQDNGVGKNIDYNKGVFGANN